MPSRPSARGRSPRRPDQPPNQPPNQGYARRLPYQSPTANLVYMCAHSMTAWFADYVQRVSGRDTHETVELMTNCGLEIVFGFGNLLLHFIKSPPGQFLIAILTGFGLLWYITRQVTGATIAGYTALTVLTVLLQTSVTFFLPSTSAASLLASLTGGGAA